MRCVVDDSHLEFHIVSTALRNQRIPAPPYVIYLIADSDAVDMDATLDKIDQCWHDGGVEAFADNPRSPGPGVDQRASLPAKHAKPDMGGVTVSKTGHRQIDVVGNVGRGPFGQAGSHLLRADREGKMVRFEPWLAGSDGQVQIRIGQWRVGSSEKTMQAVAGHCSFSLSGLNYRLLGLTDRVPCRCR